MTSAEFAAKYRVLKTLAENGARSQIAQEVALGRMVMVHRLEVGSPAENQRLMSQLASLDASGAEKVFGVWDVDGTQVIVTHFLTTFTDLPSWLASHAAAPNQALDALDAKTVVIAAPPPTVQKPAVQPPPPPPTKPAEGSFTALFGAVNSPPVAPAPTAPAPAPVAPPPVAAKEPGDFTRVFQGQRATPPAHKPAAPPAPSAPGSFTSVFGQASATPARSESLPPTFRSNAASAPPVAPGVARFESVIPPVEPPRPQPAAPPPAAPSINPSSNDFTSLFARLDPSKATPPASSAFSQAPPPMAPPAPAPSFAPPAPSFAPPQAAPPSYSPPNFSAPPAPPMMPPPGSMLPGQSAPPVAGGPSEFTRVLGRVGQPQVAPSAAQFPGNPPSLPTPSNSNPAIPQQAAPARSDSTPARSTRSYLPLIIALNVVLILAIVVVVFFIVRK